MITKEQKKLVQDTVPVLKEHGIALTSHFYNRMFTHNPELKNVFNMGNQQSGKQQTSLALAVLAYAENIENPSVLLEALNKIGNKHKSLDIRPEHYAIVGKHLIASIAEVMGEGASQELLQAWTAAYNQLAALMIGIEDHLYKQAVSEEGGWTGWRPFVVRNKVQESEEITSFYLYPADGGKVAGFRPGQYVSVRVFLSQLNLFQPRQYSLSSAPNGSYYRISVKREPELSTRPEGMVSNHLHSSVEEGNIIEVSAPAGDFILEEEKETPIVFISGGVGQTPFISMLEQLTKKKSQRSVTWVHGCRNHSVHAFRKLVESAAQVAPVKSRFFYETTDSNGRTTDIFEGIVDLKKLSDLTTLRESDIYICGPAPFIKKQFQDLTAMGVNKESIHYEEFGPNTLNLN